MLRQATGLPMGDEYAMSTLKRMNLVIGTGGKGAGSFHGKATIALAGAARDMMFRRLMTQSTQLLGTRGGQINIKATAAGWITSDARFQSFHTIPGNAGRTVFDVLKYLKDAGFGAMGPTQELSYAFSTFMGKASPAPNTRWILNFDFRR